MVLGNALHLLVNGVSEEDQQRLSLPMDDLCRLHGWLEPIRANEMTAALDRLPLSDRSLLADALALCSRLADTQAEHLLGAPAEIRDAVLAHLRSSTAGQEELA